MKRHGAIGFLIGFLSVLCSPVSSPAQIPDCAFCEWLPGAFCRYDGDGDVTNCTQCAYWHCCGELGCREMEEEETALALAGDGSILSPLDPTSRHIFGEEGSNWKGRKVLLSCDGLVLARLFDDEARSLIIQRYARIEI
jgi:hypothetical protein